MNRLLELLSAMLTTGRDHQSFIGAAWLRLLLRCTPGPFKRKVALWVVSLSPHYFYRVFNPDYKTMPLGRFLEAEYARNVSSREIICNELLLRYVKPGDEILDIGCGPGFLAKAVSRHVKTVYACDISQGVLACARIINHADNVRYIYSGDAGFAQIGDSSLDLVYSIAVIQHVREPVIKYFFGIASQKLRPGGQCVFQVQLEGDGQWRNESASANDTTVTGRLRLKYGLNCFSRTLDFFREIAADNGLELVDAQKLTEFFTAPVDDIQHQHLLILRKTGAARTISS